MLQAQLCIDGYCSGVCLQVLIVQRKWHSETGYQKEFRAAQMLKDMVNKVTQLGKLSLTNPSFTLASVRFQPCACLRACAFKGLQAIAAPVITHGAAVFCTATCKVWCHTRLSQQG